MKLEKREDLASIVWVNDKQITDANRDTYSEITEDCIYFHLKSPAGDSVKIKMAKQVVIQEVEQ